MVQIKSIYGKVLFEYDGADLRGADLQGQELTIARTRILPEGDIIGYKKCASGIHFFISRIEAENY